MYKRCIDHNLTTVQKRQIGHKGFTLLITMKMQFMYAEFCTAMITHLLETPLFSPFI